ncbi:T9SS type A sorting domain-containing protein [Flavobacterium sp. 7A]|uniref:T9SS type A sorting domain-containing protein n=1 Tax=Flavobacterium sp. 7A TaxID=2940571 RepID=UPI002227388A|nr:T9SS type A sorting domain-containing protein [Flavobacterium sp. 7A]MCW2120618.1 agarase [Flavobacterium sp. 7A]
MKKQYLILLLVPAAFFAQVKVDVNLNVKHTVGGVSTFERSKFITMHANTTEAEWDGDNQIVDLRNDFLNGLDVYLGRETGLITYTLNQVAQDPARAGYASPTDIASRGLSSRNSFAAKTNLAQYESRKGGMIFGGQLYPFWTGVGQKPTAKGWNLANGTATGEYMGRFMKEFFGGNGPSLPAFLEIVNEPDYELLGGVKEYTKTIAEIANFHIAAADAIRAQMPNTKICGYTNSFPYYEVGEFQRWFNRDKMFMDMAGSKMDYYSIHLYDFPTIGGKRQMRSGSNLEATFDMMDHYGKLSVGSVKPYVLSEYGAQTHDSNNQQWSSYRDWLNVKSFNSMLMSFLERPNTIASAIPFVIVKAEWGYNSTTGVPYTSRLMRKANEPASYTGQWVYTDFVKFYQQWKNVKGTRVDIKSDDPDILVKAYVDGNKGYVIINNLEQAIKTIDLSLFDHDDRAVTQIVKRYLTLTGNQTDLQETTTTTPITSLTIGSESHVILEYTFANPIAIDRTLDETKYYADDYLKPIVAANTPVLYNVNGITKGTYGEAVLRVGVGRATGKSLVPVIKVNNTIVATPTDFRGDNQPQRDSFFGVLEIPVPYSLLAANNVVSVQFPDAGGHVSSVCLQVNNFSHNIRLLSNEKFQYDNQISISPNPAKEQAVLTIVDDLVNSTANIYNVQGALVQEVNLAQLANKLDISKLTKGVYFVVIVKNNIKMAKTKLIVN